MQTTRPDTTTVKAVEAGIALLAIGRAEAVAFLIRNRVRDTVIARVLCEPERRRPTHPST